MFIFDIFCLQKICFFGLEAEEDNIVVREEYKNISYPRTIVMER